MQNFFAKSGAISLKIWLFALLSNTVLGSLMLGGLKPDFVDFFMYGALFGSIFSFPVFLIFWIMLYFLFQNRIEHPTIMGWLFMTGALLALAVFVCFIYWFGNNVGNVFALCALAIVSGITGIASQIRAIKNTCKKRDEEFMIGTPSSV